MTFRKSFKPIVTILGAGLVFLLTFQNCSKPKNAAETPLYGHSENSSVLASEKDLSVINLPIFPTHFENLTTGIEVYGNCLITNVTRDMVVSVFELSGKTDCATKCSENQSKFPGDKISCTFPGGSTNSSIETSKNYCRIVVSEKQVKLDTYTLDRASCITQCQILGKGMDKSTGLKCEWQNRLLFFRISDDDAPVELGSCTISAKDAKGVLVARLVYNSSTTEESCSNIVTKMKDKFLVNDVTYVFTKAEYVIIP